jgi:hypothetical protein
MWTKGIEPAYTSHARPNIRGSLRFGQNWSQADEANHEPDAGAGQGGEANLLEHLDAADGGT